MPDRPYTDDDLRTEAARQHAENNWDPDRITVWEQMQHSEIDSLLPPTEADGAECTHWGDLGRGDQEDAQQKVYGLVSRAADVSAWAVNLGADGLAPSTEHQLTLDGDSKPFARIHFAFEPDMSERMKNALVTGIAQALAQAL